MCAEYSIPARMCECEDVGFNNYRTDLVEVYVKTDVSPVGSTCGCMSHAALHRTGLTDLLHVCRGAETIDSFHAAVNTCATMWTGVVVSVWTECDGCPAKGSYRIGESDLDCCPTTYPFEESMTKSPGLGHGGNVSSGKKRYVPCTVLR